VSALIRALHRAWAWIRGLARRVTGSVAQIARIAGTRTVTFVRTAVERLTERWHTDSSYQRTLLAALAAITAVVVPHRAAAAALAALIADRPTRPAYRRDLFLDDDGEDEDYPPRRPTRPADPWTPGPRRLWDSLDQ
jgi:hypothetical protein